MPRAILLAVLLPALSAAQQLPIRSYTVADGLAEGRVNSIRADSRGFVWIGASGGLSRFDGFRMKTYGVEDGLPNLAVNTILEMPSGAYLVGTYRGLGRFENHGSLPFTAYPLEGKTPVVEAMLADPTDRVLLATNVGVFEGGPGAAFRRMAVDESIGTRIITLARGRDGNLWISGNTALEILNPSGGAAVFHVGRELPAGIGHVAALLEQPAGRMWAATYAGLALFVQGEGGSGEWRYSRMFTTADGLTGNDIADIATDAEGRVWLATAHGISRFAPDGALPPRFENLRMAQGLSGELITALARDTSGNMWAGTENAGVMRIARQGFVSYHEASGLQSERIAQVMEDRDGELLTVTEGELEKRAFAQFDGARFRPVFTNSVDDVWNWQRILLQAKGGEWWLATSHGLLRYPPTKAAGLAAARATLYPAREVFYQFEDSRGGIWAASNSPVFRGLMRLDPATRRATWFGADGSAVQAPVDFLGLVSAMAEDRAHNIWMGFLGGGLVRYSGGRFTRFGESEGIPAGGIRSLLIDRQGRLWVGAAGGLGLVAGPAASIPHFELYDKARGLSSSGVSCLVDDAAGRIYIGTARGVDRLDPETGRVRHFSPLDGVPYGGFTSAIRDHTGALWFSSMSGVSRLLPESPSVPVTPKVLITSLQAGGENYTLSQLGESSIGGLSLSPAKNHVQVEFVAPDESGATLLYKIKLTGADTAWSEPRDQHSVDYRNLADGSYHFQVKAVDTEGRESANMAEVSFTVLPPVWKRWWFELAMLCAAAGLAFGLHNYRLKNSLALERMRTAIATDLHDDIGASLAQIAVLSEVAQVHADMDAPPNGHPLARIGTLAREVTDSINDIVWSIRSGDESLESLTRRMREFAEEFLLPAGIEFELEAGVAPLKLKLTLNTRRQIFLIFKECMRNLVRHSGCGAAWVRLDVGERDAVMTVADDGKGWDASRSTMPRGGNGLSNMRQRAESLGGRAEFDARPGGGCLITVRLPVHKRAFGDAVL